MKFVELYVKTDQHVGKPQNAIERPHTCTYYENAVILFKEGMDGRKTKQIVDYCHVSAGFRFDPQTAYDMEVNGL